jgi:hypothetical protein
MTTKPMVYGLLPDFSESLTRESCKNATFMVPNPRAPMRAWGYLDISACRLLLMLPVVLPVLLQRLWALSTRIAGPCVRVFVSKVAFSRRGVPLGVHRESSDAALSRKTALLRAGSRIANQWAIQHWKRAPPSGWKKPIPEVRNSQSIYLEQLRAAGSFEGGFQPDIKG